MFLPFFTKDITIWTMKSTFLEFVGGILALSCLAGSCEKPIDNRKESQDYKIIASDSNLSTAWKQTDAITVFHAVEGGVNYTCDGKFTVSDTRQGWFEGKIRGRFEQWNNYKWFAIYPHKDGITSLNGQMTYTFATGLVQERLNDRLHLENAEFPRYGYASQDFDTDEAFAPRFSFHECAGFVTLTVKNASDQPLSISEIELKAPRALSGEFRLHYSGGQLSWEAKECSETVSLKVMADEIQQGGSAEFYLGLFPVELNAGESIGIYINGEKQKDYRKSIAAGETVSISLTYGDSQSGDGGDGDNEDDPSLSCSWLELPAIGENGNMKWYYHTFEELGNSGLKGRNFSFYWSPEERLAHWVAYPLYDDCMASGNRTDDWDYDPKVPVNEQPNLSSAYSGNYSRGHQMASADRNGNRTINRTTFYYTNMTPQVQDFNGGIWNNLEIKVRGYAEQADTLYVVTGAYMTDNAKWTSDKSGKKCIVPDYYYKAILYYKGNNPKLASNYRAIGFWLKHTDRGSLTSSYVYSIDELESKTGVDFFVNLAALVGDSQAAAIEAQDPKKVSGWGI